MTKKQFLGWSTLNAFSGMLFGISVGIYLTNLIKLHDIWSGISFVLAGSLLTIREMLYKLKYKEFISSLK